MDYNAAIKELTEGKSIARASAEPGTYMKFGMDPAASHTAGPPFIFTKSTPPVVYMPTHEDASADDWEVLGETEGDE